MNTETTQPTPGRLKIRKALANLTPRERKQALDWLAKNAERHNIEAMREQAKAKKA